MTARTFATLDRTAATFLGTALTDRMDGNYMEETTSVDTIYKKTDWFISRRIAEEAVLVPLRAVSGNNDFIYALNEPAAAAWELLDGDHALSWVAQQIVGQFEVSEAEAAQDLTSLVQELVTLGALAKA